MVKIFMCVDITRRTKEKVDYRLSLVNIGIMAGTTIIYYIIASKNFELLQFLLNTTGKVAPMTILILIYVLIMQLIVRKYVLNEKEQLKQYKERQQLKRITIAKYWSPSIDGYTPIKVYNRECSIIGYRQGYETAIISMKSGSIIGLTDDEKYVHYDILASILKELNMLGYTVNYYLQDEAISKIKMFQVYNDLLLNMESDEYTETMRGIIHHIYNTTVKLAKIDEGFLEIIAVTNQQKIYLKQALTKIVKDLQHSKYRDVHVLNKPEFISFIRDWYELDYLDENVLVADSLYIKVPLGKTKVLDILDSKFNLVKRVNEYKEGKMTNTKLHVSNTINGKQRKQKDIYYTDTEEYIKAEHITKTQIERDLKDVSKVINIGEN